MIAEGNRKLSDIILDLEGEWLMSLLSYVEQVFFGTNLPSHDKEHHQRVWCFARELLVSYSLKTKTNFNKGFVEGLLISCLVHDVGLTQTLAEEHGVHSVGLAKPFLTDKLNDHTYLKEMYEAIAKHDDKSYQQAHIKKGPGIYHFLTVADDLDALGVLGLTRYLEIYSHRNIPSSELQKRIRTNLVNRFIFIEHFLSFDDSLLQKHYARYKKALKFLDAFDAHTIEILIGRICQLNFNGSPKDSTLIKELFIEYNNEVKLVRD